MLTLIVAAVLGGVLLYVLAAVVPGFELADFVSALSASVIVILFGWLAGFAVPYLPLPDRLWVTVLILFVLDLIGLQIASMTVPGVKFRSFWTMVFIALWLTALGFATPLFLASLPKKLF